MRPNRTSSPDAAALIASGRRFCYYVPADQDPAAHGGYVPSAVIENEPGHHPMTGDPAICQAPWVWGRDLAGAEKIAADFNTRLGLSADDVAHIIASSMRASNAGREVR